MAQNISKNQIIHIEGRLLRILDVEGDTLVTEPVAMCGARIEDDVPNSTYAGVTCEKQADHDSFEHSGGGVAWQYGGGRLGC